MYDMDDSDTDDSNLEEFRDGLHLVLLSQFAQLNVALFETSRVWKEMQEHMLESTDHFLHRQLKKQQKQEELDRFPDTVAGGASRFKEKYVKTSLYSAHMIFRNSCCQIQPFTFF